MKYIVTKRGVWARVYWNGSRWVLNRKRAATYAKIPARKVARELAAVVDKLR